MTNSTEEAWLLAFEQALLDAGLKILAREPFDSIERGGRGWNYRLTLKGELLSTDICEETFKMHEPDRAAQGVAHFMATWL